MDERQLGDVVFLRNPDLWPRWPLCPVLRGDEAGLVADGQPSVWKANLFDLEAGPLAETLAPFAHEDYDDMEALVAAGWRVD